MGAFATGFFGKVGDAAQDKVKQTQANEQKLKDGQAQIYWDAIKSGNLSPEQLQYSQEQLQKLYGKSKPLKQIFDKFGQVTGLYHKHAGGGQDDSGQPQGAPNSGVPSGSAPAPPPAMSEQTPIGGSSTQLPPKPQASAAQATPAPPTSSSAPRRPPSFADIAGAAYPSHASQDEREFKMYQRKQEIIKNYKIEEEQAKAKADAEAKSANPSGRPVMGPATSVRNARELAKEGKEFLDVDGKPIDLTSLPDTMGLKFVAWGGKHYYEPFSPNSKVITVGNETYAVSPMDVEALKDGAGTDMGQHRTGTKSTSKDPVTGQTTFKDSEPSTPGITGSSKSAPSLPPKISAPSAIVGPRASSGIAGDIPKLDAEGHIPNTLPGSTPQIIEGANQLLDGTDKDKLPTKTRELSSALARKYGWEQGKFTPKEQVLLREATTFLNEAANNPSMTVLDSTMSKLKLGQVLSAGDHQGFVGRTASTLSASNMTPQEAEFVRMYNQLVGTISGLSQLVRSGRATEAQIDRLKNELPNVLTAKDAEDGRKRIKRILKEVDVAMQKGTFMGIGVKSSMSPPPKKNDSASVPGAVIKWTRDAQGNPVQASP